jgi:opacity protein-like surface antigen
MDYFRKLCFIIALVVCFEAHSQNNWEGLQIEITSGYRKNKIDNDDLYGVSSGGVTSFQNSVTDVSNSNISYTIGIGYGFSVSDKALVTVGLDYLPQTWKSAAFEVGTNSAYYKYKNQFNVYVAPGWLLGESDLLYSKVGYSRVTAQGFGSNPFNDIGNPSNNLSGYVLGLGVKHSIYSRFYVLGDYAYYKFSKGKISGYDSSTTLTDYINTGITNQVLSIGLGVKF